ncbi:MAG: TIGR04076 family protein [Promethearchaeota archaeon]
MSDRMPKCRITIIKRMLNEDLINEYIIEEYKGMSKCECFEDGQEFIIDPNLAKVPEGFCHWAWADIRNEINLIASGGNIFGMRQKGTAITACTDWFRPVYFKIQRLE